MRKVPTLFLVAVALLFALVLYLVAALHSLFED